MTHALFVHHRVALVPEAVPLRPFAIRLAVARTVALTAALMNFVQAQPAGTLEKGANGTLTIEVSHLRGVRGTVRASLWNSSQTFLKDKPAAYVEAKVSGSKVLLHVSNLAHGTYALAAYQDENDNGQLDSGFMGIPKEPYGFSGKNKSRFGVPAFLDASFSFPAERVVAVRLKY